jgi:prepilin-type N-terminal cleavage/methylation domain-containing protein
MDRLRRRKGFTLAELLVVLAVAIMALSGLMLLYSRSISGIQVQDRYLTMQRQLRFGMETLKKDLRLAGFLATPNSAIDANLCPKPTNTLRSVTVRSFDGDIYLPSSNPHVFPDSLTLFGDFSGGLVFSTENIQGSTVTLIDDGSLPNSVESWAEVFQNHRFLRITTNDQYEMIISIQGSDFQSKTIKLSETPPIVSPPQMCGIEGYGVGYYVNLAYYVRYRIMDDPRTGAAADSTVLVREELATNAITAIPTTRMIVASNVVDMQFYDFVFDTDLTGLDPNMTFAPNLTSNVGSATAAELLGIAQGAAPQDLRAITVKLTARSPREDPDYMHVKRVKEHSPLNSYDLNGDLTGSCRCISAATRVQLRSLTARNLKAGGS